MSREIYFIEYQFGAEPWRVGAVFDTDRQKLQERVDVDNAFNQNTRWPQRQRVRACRLEPIDGLPDPVFQGDK